MRDLAMQISGVLAILVAVAHGVLGETRVFARAHIEPASVRRLLRGVWQCGALAWLAGGVLLLVAPTLPGDAARGWIVAVLVPVYAAGAIGNAWATRGRHIGWIAMTAVIAFALGGL